MRVSAAAFLPVLITLSLGAGLRGATLVVDLGGGGNFTEIQPAIDAAADGDTVLVRPGEYVISESITFRGKAITVRGEAGAEETVIHSDGSGHSVVRFGSGETPNSRLEGFTLRGAKVFCMYFSCSPGGGVVLEDASPTLSFCTISGNSSASGGGGVTCKGSAAPILTDCTISENFGRGVYCRDSARPILTNCTISGNLGGDGGVICRDSACPILTNCTISGNSVYEGGGGVLCRDSARPVLSSCRISGNFARDLGAYYYSAGGVYCDSGSAPTFTSCTISGNRAGHVGAVWCSSSSAPTFTSCTISGNSAQYVGGVYSDGSSATLTSCIVWGNSRVSLWTDGEARPEVSHSCMETEEVWPGEGNINSDPLFLDKGAFDFTRFVTVEIGGVELPDFVVEPPDFRLRKGSPAIDAGICAGGPEPEIDIDGTPRPWGAGCDIGAYEYSGPIELPFVRGDSNSDGPVNISDAIAVLRFLFLGSAEPPCLASADTDDTGALDLNDAVYLLDYLFLDGSEPPAPFPACGLDATADALGCERFAPCEGRGNRSDPDTGRIH